MPDKRLPRDPHLPTIPAPPEGSESFVELARDLRGAITNVGEKMAKLETYLMRLELAALAGEHKQNTALVGVDELRKRAAATEQRTRAIEERLGMAAE
jgi:hypothetical protein